MTKDASLDTLYKYKFKQCIPSPVERLHIYNGKLESNHDYNGHFMKLKNIKLRCVTF